MKNVSWDPDNLFIRWFEDGTLNVSANCIDRHLSIRANQTAIIWEPDDPNEAARQITYEELHREVCRFANVLKAHGVSKGDRVTIYLPMIPEAAYAMLACCAHRRDPFRDFRGFLAGFHCRPHRRTARAPSLSRQMKVCAAASRSR